MGCRSDYMEPTMHETENAKVLAIIEELKTGKLPSWYGNGSYTEVYSLTTQKILDTNTEKLCSALQKLSKKKISESSLELQMWWRDHQEADKKRIKEELAAKRFTHTNSLLIF